MQLSDCLDGEDVKQKRLPLINLLEHSHPPRCDVLRVLEAALVVAHVSRGLLNELCGRRVVCRLNDLLKSITFLRNLSRVL